MTRQGVRRLFLLALSLISIFAVSHPSKSVFAQTVEEQGSTLVTASIPDHFKPTAPILVYPENNSIISDNTPGFVWIGSIDDTQMQYYQLVIDDEIVFDHLPLENYENDDYILTYDPISNQYTLTPKDNLLDGIHTWKVIAVDSSGNSHDSVTWTFTIDTLAPVFIVINVGEEETSISAQDASTVPEEPIVLQENNPLIKAVGEPLSQVELTITIPGDCPIISNCQKKVTIQVDQHGNWQHSLGLLPRDVVITLDFLITDQAGHISVIKNVKIIIPDTGLPPKEIIKEIVDDVTDLLPPPIQQLTSAIPREVRTTIVISPDTFSGFLALLVALSIPLTTIVMIATKFGTKFSLELLFKLIQALGLHRSSPPQGIVFDDETNQGVPFALVIVTSNIDQQDTATRPESDIAITDERGMYRGLKLPEGDYRLSAQEPYFIFPTNKKRPQRLVLHDYYKGENFSIVEVNKKPILPILLIPASRISFEEYFSFMWHLRVFLAKLNRHPSLLVVGLLGVTTLISIVYSTIINWLVVAGYSSILLVRLYNRFKKPILSGVVARLDSSPLPGTIVVTRTQNFGTEINTRETLHIANKKGEFSLTANDLFYSGKKTTSNSSDSTTIILNAVHVHHNWRTNDNEISSQKVMIKQKEKINTTTVLVPIDYQGKNSKVTSLPTVCLTS